MEKTTNQVFPQYVYNCANSNQVVIADRVISVREADKEAQQLRKAYTATLA
jgi:hypothetical protein